MIGKVNLLGLFSLKEIKVSNKKFRKNKILKENTQCKLKMSRLNLFLSSKRINNIMINIKICAPYVSTNSQT